MICEGDGTWERWLRFGRCPKCQTMLSDMQGGSVKCESCKLTIMSFPATTATAWASVGAA